jgi:MFS family permease
MTPRSRNRTGIFGAALWTTSLGSCALVFLSAFESLAVTTIMPVISAEFHGAGLYAMAFAGPMATGIVGMVVAGTWSDRSGPAPSLYAAVALFAGGLLVCGLAGSMEVLVAGRLVQGFGGGAITVALYVLVARAYPPPEHPAIFAAFAAAWVVPSMVGPLVAGFIADTVGWRWVFLGVVVLVAAATLMIRPALQNLPPQPRDGVRDWALRRLGWSVFAAVAVLALNRAGIVEGIGPWLAIAAAGVALLAVRPLLPQGTLLARRGLPSVILARAAASASFMGCEVYLPYLLTSAYGYPPTLAGLALTGSALAWAGGSAIQGRLGDRLPHARAVLLGGLLLLLGTAAIAVAELADLPGTVAIAGLAGAGGGMGLVYPRLSVLTLSLSEPASQGFNSSALVIADSFGAAFSLAITGVVFAAFGAAGFGAVFVFVFVLALGMLWPGLRVGARSPLGAAEAAA